MGLNNFVSTVCSIGIFLSVYAGTMYNMGVKMCVNNGGRKAIQHIIPYNS